MFQLGLGHARSHQKVSSDARTCDLQLNISHRVSLVGGSIIDQNTMETQMRPKRKKETLWPCTIGPGGKAKIYQANRVAFYVYQFLKFQLVG